MGILFHKPMDVVRKNFQTSIRSRPHTYQTQEQVAEDHGRQGSYRPLPKQVELACHPRVHKGPICALSASENFLAGHSKSTTLTLALRLLAPFPEVVFHPNLQ